MSASSKLIEGAKEALAIAKGKQPAAAIWIDGFKYVPETDVVAIRQELGLAREDLARFRSERSYVIGCNTGWDEAIEQAVKVLEDYAQRLVPDPANDRARYHVRYAADDVRALAAGKEG